MEQLFLVVVSGIASGAVYGLLGLGLVIIYRATDVVNFALASMATLAVYVALMVVDRGLGVWAGLLAAVLVAVVVGLLVREVLLRPLGSGRLFAALVMTMGVSLVIEALVSAMWGTEPRAFPPLVAGSVSFGSAALATQDLVVIGVSAAAMLAVGWLFTRTTLGSAMRAAAESATTAQIIGVPAQKVARIAWALGLGLAALASVLYAPRVGLAPMVLSAPLFRAFAGIFLGGLTSMHGAVIGGVTIGVLENLAASYVSANFRDTFVFALTVLILLLRPQGIFGTRSFERV
ncbi:branched-chain amino acid ABC transporter permease [Pseudonocardia broussonetiae]|uniref:Branched-chain amino acid ABC transporter permease n=1 Tax=Pseudonocardia broussonetiae TaxID=2736640 RepID=A0A6M6JGF4_9PSEU|nr:branched-chain amino acid ABC transporter permease [Pseudonocardia broussonetiae]QJY47108.1 branched-chain amino acid ABC transporter permease [Pseudonocardia broussonetiae]